MSTDHVLFYYQPGCSECDEAKEFLDETGIPYLAFDVAKDSDALQDLHERWGCTQCATIVIEGEIYAGFRKNLNAIRDHTENSGSFPA
jgi:glutaredoxin